MIGLSWIRKPGRDARYDSTTDTQAFIVTLSCLLHLTHYQTRR